MGHGNQKQEYCGCSQYTVSGSKERRKLREKHNEFWKLNRTYSNVQGGFIWDWADQSLATTREDGKTFWAYGGVWMDASSNADAFCANGVLFADHTPSAKAVQMRYDHQQVNFYLENEDAKVTDGTIKVKVVNELENSTLENYNIIWSLKKDDEEIATKTISLNTPGMDGEPLEKK